MSDTRSWWGRAGLVVLRHAPAGCLTRRRSCVVHNEKGRPPSAANKQHPAAPSAKNHWNVLCLGAILLAFAAGGCGYYLRAFRENSTTSLPLQSLAGFDYYFSWESFSEVDEAKALLQASAAQAIQELRERPHVGVFDVKTGIKSQVAGKNAQLQNAVDELEQKIKEFSGTEQELLLVQEMLWILWREASYDQLVDTYLGVLYAHPTHALVGHFADKAFQCSQLAGRQQEMLKGFRHVLEIPMEFTAKRQVRTVLKGVNLVAQASFP